MLAAVPLKGTAQMTLSDLGSIANLLAAIGVLMTLGYLSRQVRQANMLAKAQHRQCMVEQACEELYVWKKHPTLRTSSSTASCVSIAPEVPAGSRMLVLRAVLAFLALP